MLIIIMSDIKNLESYFLFWQSQLKNSTKLLEGGIGKMGINDEWDEDIEVICTHTIEYLKSCIQYMKEYKKHYKDAQKRAQKRAQEKKLRY